MAGTTADCVRVDVVSVPYSAEDVRAAGRRVLESQAHSERRPEVARAADGYAGLIVGYVAVPSGREAEELRLRLERIAGMPVVLGPAAPTYE